MSVPTPNPLSEQEHAKLVRRARNIALHRLTGGARTEKQLSDALNTKNIPPTIIETTIIWLREYDYVNDERYAKERAEAKNRNGMGRRAIEQDLLRKGVPQTLISETLTLISEKDEYATARAFALKWLHSCRNLEKDAAYRRIAGMLARRGFPPNIVYEITNETLANHTPTPK